MHGARTRVGASPRPTQCVLVRSRRRSYCTRTHRGAASGGCFATRFYWEDAGLNETEVKALALERLTKTDRRIKRAVAMMEQTSAFTAPSRETIPDHVKVFVWNRDAGRCVRCGSNERLEFDHVIPVALGGANTARNLQLLCETCNRSKGASIA